MTERLSPFSAKLCVETAMGLSSRLAEMTLRTAVLPACNSAMQ